MIIPIPVSRVLAAMAIADVLVFGGLIAREQVARSGQTVKLPVEGYDPRDLISGHYVSFRLVAANEAQPMIGAEPNPQFCMESRDDRLHVSRLKGPGDDCTPFISATLGRYGQLDFGVNRFYVDERIANDVRFVQAGPDTYLVATIDGDGVVHAIQLVVNGNRLDGRQR